MSHPVAGIPRERITQGTGSERGLQPVGDILFQFLSREARAGDLAAKRMLQACRRAREVEEETIPHCEKG